MRYTDNLFTNHYITTLGLELVTFTKKTKYLEIKRKRVKLQLWDTAGQERFRNITSNYYRGANAILIVFDLSDRHSFDMITTWLEEIERNSGQDTFKVIVGNKSDLHEKRAVSKEEAVELSVKHGLKYFETSAKTGEKVKDVFHYIAGSFVQKVCEIQSPVKSDSCILAEAPCRRIRKYFLFRCCI
jgi:small GTP-binding protein